MSEADDYGQDEEDHEALEPWEYSDCGMTDDICMKMMQSN